MTNFLLVFGLSSTELIIILIIILLLFGGKKIPELMKGLGKGVKTFKEGVNEAKKELEDVQKDIDAPVREKETTRIDNNQTV